MNRIFLKIIFKSYLFFGVILVLSFFCAMMIFLLNSAFGVLENIDAENSALTTLLNILSDLWPPIAGTFLITLFAVGLAIPAGIITGVFINEYAKKQTRQFYIFVFKVIAGTPSIVIGVFGFVLLLWVNQLFAVSFKTSFLVSGFALALLILPYIVHSTVIALSAISKETRIGALSLGAKKYQTIFRILLPEAFVSLSSGIVLAIGRACEDTAVIMLTGVAAFAGLPSSFTSSFEALPFYIYFHASEYQNQYELTSVFVATILVIVICCGFIVTANLIKNKIGKKFNYDHS